MSGLILLCLFNWFDWKTLKTDDFTVIYRQGYYTEALHTLRNLEYYKDAVRRIIGDGHRGVPVVIEDVGAVSNGFANPLFNNIHIFTHAPGFSYRMEGMESWYRVVAVHEYAHILHLSRTRGFSRVLNDVFGPVFAPNIYSPGWIIEGITVYNESQGSLYEGRLNDGFFDGYIGARVHAGAMPSIVEATNTPHDFPFGAYYLYGGEFFSFLAHEYGEDRFSDFFERYGSYFWAPLSAVLPFSGIDIAVRRVYGKSFPELFNEWREYEESRHQNWQPAGTRLTDHGWYMYSLEEAGGKIYYVRYLPVKVDGFSQMGLVHIVEHDPEYGRERILKTLSGVTSAPIRLVNNKLYYASHDLSRGYANIYYNGYGIVINLHELDIETGADKILLTEDIRGFCILPDRGILYSRDRSDSFGSEIWFVKDDEQRMLLQTDLLVNEMVAAGARVAVVARHDFENWDIFLFDVAAGDFQPVVQSPWIEGSISLHLDTLLFTANYGRVYSIYALDLTTGTLCRLTHEGYADHGVVIGQSVYFQGLSKDGFDLYQSRLDPIPVEIPKTAPSVKPDLEAMDLTIQNGGYADVLATLLPSVRLPFAVPTKHDFSAWAYGLFFLGGDATNENMYGGILGHDIDQDDALFYLLWQSRFFSPLDLTFFYDYRNSLECNVSLPAFLSSEYGLSNITLFLNSRFFNSYTRREFSPGFGIGFRFPYTSFSLTLALPYERQAWGSDIHRSAQQLTVGLKQFLNGGELCVYGRAYVDRHNPEVQEFRIRGSEVIESSRAVVLSTEYVRRLCRVRWGLWNPNIYFEDLYWAAFIDYAWTEEGSDYYSAGGELRLEVKTGFGFLQLVPKLGFALTDARKIKLHFGISPVIPI